MLVPALKKKSLLRHVHSKQNTVMVIYTKMLTEHWPFVFENVKSS